MNKPVLSPKFNYRTLTRSSEDGIRRYNTPDGEKLVSVTTILDKTKPSEKVKALQEWRNYVGGARARQITSEAANTGTVMHKMLEEYITNNAKPPGSNLIQRIAYPMAQTIIAYGLIHLSECWGTEVSVWYPGLYAGSTDAVGVWKNKPAIIDFKQTNKVKSSAAVEDYRLQLVAYGEAHNKVYGTNIKTGCILMCSRACEYQEFILEGDEWDKYVDQWWDRVSEYYQNAKY